MLQKNDKTQLILLNHSFIKISIVIVIEMINVYVLKISEGISSL